MSEPSAPRAARQQRETKETNVAVELVVDGVGAAHASTGIPFFESTDTGLRLDLGYAGDSLQLTGFFRLAHEKNAVRTLSAPQIMLSNGQRGYITISTQTAAMTCWCTGSPGYRSCAYRMGSSWNGGSTNRRRFRSWSISTATARRS